MGADITGVYKCWVNRCREPLGEAREKYLEEFNKVRKLWVFKGYPITRMIRKIRKKKTSKK